MLGRLFISVVLVSYILFCNLQILETHDKVAQKTEIYVPYNILPLDPDSADQAIMRYPEVCLDILLCMFG